MLLRQGCAIPHCLADVLGTFGDRWFCRDHYLLCVVEFKDRQVVMRATMARIAAQNPTTVSKQDLIRADQQWESAARYEVAQDLIERERREHKDETP